MGTPVDPDRRYTIAEYLRLEEAALDRHEYRDGQIVAMPPSSVDHSVIAVNVMSAIHRALEGQRYGVCNCSLRVRVASPPLLTYTDGVVVPLPPRLDPDDPTTGTVANPQVIVEVVLPETEAYDRGEKFSQYREIESLRDYVLVSCNSAEVDVFHKQEDGTWIFTAATGLDARIRVPSIGAEVALAEVYDKVDLPPQPEVPQED